MFPVMHQYKLRLTNLSQSNRSLKLGKLSVRKDLDLLDAGFVNGLSAADILGKIIGGHAVTLIKSLSTRDEATNLLDRRLNSLFHEVETIREETGTYDLFLGYPFVEGKFLDGSIARCPLVLFPVRLHRDFQGGPRWVLRPNPEEDLSFNTTFLLAYEKFMQARLPQEFWDDDPERHDDLQGFLNGLYKQLTDYGLALHFNSELFQFRVDRFMDKNAALLDQLQVGMLRLVPNAVLGIFPQSDSALLQDYEVLEREADHFELPRFFEERPRLPEVAFPKEEERYFVSSVDQSQEEALLRVRAGESVVLHGPPGTGKSQVILNLISDALARGQRVLVCSQKRAALDVVFQRMQEVGLGRFAALVHDYRADRNMIFARIRQQIDDIEKFEEERRDIGLDLWLRDFRRDSRKLDEHNELFEQLFQALTQRGRFGLAAHDLYLLADPHAPQVDMTAVAAQYDHDAWRSTAEVLSSILEYDEFFTAAHPWRERLPLHRLGYAGRASLAERLRALPQALASLHQTWEGMQGPGTSIDHPEQLGEVLPMAEQLLAQAELPGSKDDFAAAQRDGLTVAYLRDQLAAVGKLAERMAGFQVLKGFPLNLLDDLKRHVAAYGDGRRSATRFFSLRWLQGWWYLRQLLKRQARKLEEGSFKQIHAELEVLVQLVALSMDLDDHAFFKDLPIADGAEVLGQWLVRKLQNTELIALCEQQRDWLAFRPRVAEGRFDEAHWAVVRADVGRMRAAAAALSEFGAGWKPWLHPAQLDRLQKGLIYPEPAATYAADLLASFDKEFDDICQLDTLLDNLSAPQRLTLEHLAPHIGRIGEGSKAEMLAAAQNGMYLAWLSLMEAANPVLLEASSRQMAERMANYRELVGTRTKTVTGLIQRKLKDAILDKIEYNRLSNPVTYRDIGHQVRKQRQLWPVRKLVQAYWEDGLSRLMPCWMASPESVSAIFPMLKDHFDLVIFDEASQCYVERALPVMLRGRQCVIAGDDQQLPPFDLYNVKAEEEGFAEDEMALEVESILDLCRNLFQQCKLNWHYRSTEKALINFSNFAFYEGRLNMVPPAAHEALSQPPISFVKVDGRWSQNRNEVEARRVVQEVEELLRHPDQPTVGVVTFNFHQKELIRELLELRVVELNMMGDQEAANRLLRAAQREEGEERQGLFVKNIENVQGDERDVIIFSIGYARNAEGKLVANFGLLNQKGGGNRLNVAITRAKKKKVVVCSIDPEELSVDGSKHEGPRLLKRYLQYARAMSVGDLQAVEAILGQLRTAASEASQGLVMGQRLVARLQEALEAEGWKVERGLGDHNFTLDLAVIDADGRYLVGVEVEGKNYFSGRTAKEREVYRSGLLARRGWRLHRVWARNFFLNPGQEVRRIIELAEEARKR